jgi:uncharacterized protein YdbL (DUF1318 family)
MTFIRHLLFAVTLVFAGAAFALELDSAKSQGLVGEQPNGYLGVVKATSEAVAYQRIARENGISLEQVANLAGQKAIEKTPAGEYVKTPTGQWVTK